MGQFSSILYNQKKGKSVCISANSEKELFEKETAQRRQWAEEETRQEIEAELIKQNEAISVYKDIIISNLRKIDYKIFFKETTGKEGPLKFRSQYKKPSLESISAVLNVPKRNSMVEEYMAGAYERRVMLEAQAKDLYGKKMREYRALIRDERKDFERIRELSFDPISNELLSINDRHKRFLKKDNREVEYVMICIKSKLKYIPIDVVGKKGSFIEFEYIPDRELIIISRRLPNLSEIPNYSEVTWNSKTKTYDKKTLSDKEKKKLHEDVIFQIALITLRNIFDTFPKQVVNEVVFNGWLDYVSSSKGVDETACVISIDVERDSFNKIDLKRVNFKSCIKGLNGSLSPNIVDITPIQPKLELNRKDKRFINSKDVSSVLDDGFNLATMDWEDFEYLIRQLFSKVFSNGDSEVKITQASRDGGVDAVAFDPDPIRGGKFIIQAKRYNILVPVSAVRDLYGTMLHEGATRGILVTTSNYGKDSYSFSKDKPITLINGQELLGLMQQYGFKDVKIQLHEKFR